MPENHVFIDECGNERDYVREYGRAAKGVRVEDSKRGRKFQRLNVVAAICEKIPIAPKCYSGSMNGDFFEAWFKDELLPKLKSGQTVTLDNASFHRKAKLYDIVENTNVKLLFLPPYSPDYNPIEKTWANMKRALPDLIPKFGSLEIAIYSYLGVSKY